MKGICRFIAVFSVLFCFAFVSYAQSGAVYTIAGGGTSTANGVPALSAQFTSAYDVCLDGAGNLFVSDDGANIVRKINLTTGLIYTVAGNGTAGYSGDGGAATSASLNKPRGLAVDHSGNLYIAELNNRIVRKVNLPTGLISTFAGNPAATSLGDGGPAVNAQFDMPDGLVLDDSMNLYIADAAGGRIRKVNNAGIITTYVMDTATSSVRIGNPVDLTFDLQGNMIVGAYMSMHTSRINKITRAVTRIDSATGAHNRVFVDALNDVYIGDRGGSAFMHKVDGLSGAVTLLTSPPYSAIDGTDFTHSILSANFCIDADGNVYCGNGGTVRKINSFSVGHASVANLFKFFIEKSCDGPKIKLRIASYVPGMYAKMSYGDGVTDSLLISPLGGGAGIAVGSHIYNATGDFTMKCLLFNAGVAIDSVTYSTHHSFCRTMPLRFYLDNNFNCTKESSELYLSKFVRVEVDSNGVPVDTLSAANGFDYYTKGDIGDVFTFKIISLGAGHHASCPSSGIISQVLSTASNPTSWFGINCTSVPAVDLSIRSVVPVTGVRNQRGHIYVQNATCLPVDGAVAMSFSPKYVYAGNADPPPSIVSGNTLTWNVSGISPGSTGVVDLMFVVNNNLALSSPSVGDTVHEHFAVSVISGVDSDLSNNYVVRVDTVKASCDPNLIEVTPSSCFSTDTTFEFMVHFENTGNDTAHNIYVLDTLSDNLDPATLEVELNSHPMFLSRLTDGPHTIFKFNFPDIKLPDSSHTACAMGCSSIKFAIGQA